jgi:hypothetical protein
MILRGMPARTSIFEILPFLTWSINDINRRTSAHKAKSPSANSSPRILGIQSDIYQHVWPGTRKEWLAIANFEILDAPVIY